MMRAIYVRDPGGLDNLELVDAKDPGQPGPGQIRVELHATSVNFHDYLVVIGQIPTPDNRIPMTDGAGIVTAVGDGVTGFAVGDRVISNFFPDWADGVPDQRLLLDIPGDTADGYACEHIVRSAKSFTHAPKDYTYAQAATLSCAGLTAWRGLVVEGGIKAGDAVLVQGSGGVSLFALQIAKAAGARVIATSSSDEKLDRLRDLGADHLINYRTTPEWGEIARSLAGGDGVDHVMEVGGAATLPESMKSVKNGGHISLVGVLTGFAGPLPTADLMRRQIRLIGITVGASRHLADFVSALDANAILPVIDESYPLERLGDAFRRQESGKHFGKIVVEW